jgi:DNA-binding NarL/FixJ family response regulator
VLTPRETQVYELLAEGRSNSEIARALFISEKTAKVHVRNVLHKLGVQNRTQAAILAARDGASACSTDVSP